MNQEVLKIKQKKVLETMICLNKYELTELEVNTLFSIQGLILERIMKEKK